jgi:hypothetical protein
MAQPDDNSERDPAADAAASKADQESPDGKSSSLRTWTDKSGQHKIDAELVGSNDGKVQLKKKDGTVIVVPIEKLSQSDQEFVRQSKAGGEAEDDGPGNAATRPDHRPKRASLGPRDKPAIISYLKPEMELYVAAETYTPPEKTRGKTARTTCTCNLVCTCESVSTCGCNLVRVRNPIDVGVVCLCDTVPVCTCNMVTSCACDRVSTSVCTCDLVCTCDTVPVPGGASSVPGSQRRCVCLSVCSCEHVGGGGGFGGSVCCCVPVIH